MGVSLRLLLIGSILGSLAGVAAGAYGAVKQYGWSDRLITLISFVILSIPTVVLAVFIAIAASFNALIGRRLSTTRANTRPGLPGGLRRAWSIGSST